MSWYRSPYTLAAIQMLLDAGVRTNIHYVLGKNSIDEALERLEHDDFPEGVNAVIFLLHKPAGQGREDSILSPDDPRVAAFFAQVDRPHRFKVGMDSCTVPGAINHCKRIVPESLDTSLCLRLCFATVTSAGEWMCRTAAPHRKYQCT